MDALTFRFTCRPPTGPFQWRHIAQIFVLGFVNFDVISSLPTLLISPNEKQTCYKQNYERAAWTSCSNWEQRY